MENKYMELKTIEEMRNLYQSRINLIVAQLKEMPRPTTSAELIKEVSAKRRDIMEEGHQEILAFVKAVKSIDVYCMNSNEICALYDVFEGI